MLSGSGDNVEDAESGRRKEGSNAGEDRGRTNPNLVSLKSEYCRNLFKSATAAAAHISYEPENRSTSQTATISTLQLMQVLKHINIQSDPMQKLSHLRRAI